MKVGHTKMSTWRSEINQTIAQEYDYEEEDWETDADFVNIQTEEEQR